MPKCTQHNSWRSSKRSPGRSTKHTKVRWLGTSHTSVLGACWKQAKVERKIILGRKACTRKATTRRKSNTRACMEDLTTSGLGFLQYIVMVDEPKMYKYIYLGLIEKGREEIQKVVSVNVLC
jgi:hypothetical protein